MHRRRVLAALAAVATLPAAGCLAAPAGGFRQDGESTSDGAARYPSLTARADPSPHPSLAVTVSVVRVPDERGPARLRVTVENTGDRERTATFGAVPPFTKLWGEHVDGAGGAVLVPLDHPHKTAVIPASPANHAWRATGDVAVNATAVVKTLDPGDRLSRTYAVLADADSDRLHAGAYRFKDERYVGDEPWGFTVAVSN